MAPRDRSQRIARPGLAERDLFNPQFGDRLAMAVPRANSLLRLVAKRHDLGSERLAYDARADRRTIHERRADEEILAVVGEEHAIEDDFRVSRAGNAIEAENLAFLYFEVSAVCFDDRVHVKPFDNRIPSEF